MLNTRTTIFFIAIFGIFISSCKNDHDNFGQLKGINYISRNDVFPLEQISFKNADGIANDTLKYSGLLTIAPNTFTNEDGSSFSGKVILSIKEDYARGYMALNSIPTVGADGNPLYVVGSFYISAVDVKGYKLKIASGKNIELIIPGNSVSSQNKMYYAEDMVADPAPANTSLFKWIESSTDTVIYNFNSNNSKYYYHLKTNQLGWTSCAHPVANSNSVGITVRVSGFFQSFATNTAVYVVPKNGKSAFRLWNYDSKTNKFSTDLPYLEKDSEVYIIVIAVTRHFKTYYAKELITVAANTDKTVTAVEVSLATISANLFAL